MVVACALESAFRCRDLLSAWQYLDCRRVGGCLVLRWTLCTSLLCLAKTLRFSAVRFLARLSSARFASTAKHPPCPTKARVRTPRPCQRGLAYAPTGGRPWSRQQTNLCCMRILHANVKGLIKLILHGVCQQVNHSIKLFCVLVARMCGVVE